MKLNSYLAFLNRHYRLWFLLACCICGGFWWSYFQTPRIAYLGAFTPILWIWRGTRRFLISQAQEKITWKFTDTLTVGLLGVIASSLNQFALVPICGLIMTCQPRLQFGALIGNYGVMLLVLVLIMPSLKNDWKKISAELESRSDSDLPKVNKAD